MSDLGEFRLHEGRLRQGRLADIVGRPLIPLILLALLIVPVAKVALSSAAAALPKPGLATTPGQQHTLTRTVTAPEVPAMLDLLPVLDLTGSYAKTLPTVQHILPQLQDESPPSPPCRSGWSPSKMTRTVAAAPATTPTNSTCPSPPDPPRWPPPLEASTVAAEATTPNPG